MFSPSVITSGNEFETMLNSSVNLSSEIQFDLFSIALKLLLVIRCLFETATSVKVLILNDDL